MNNQREKLRDDEVTELDRLLLDSFKRQLFGDHFEATHTTETSLIPIKKEAGCLHQPTSNK